MTKKKEIGELTNFVPPPSGSLPMIRTIANPNIPPGTILAVSPGAFALDDEDEQVEMTSQCVPGGIKVKMEVTGLRVWCDWSKLSMLCRGPRP